MEHKFDPINLTVFPKPCEAFKRANAFVAGLLVNRMIFEIAYARFPDPSKSLSSLKTIIAKLESWYDWLGKVVNPEPEFSDWLSENIDNLDRLLVNNNSGYSIQGEEFFIRRPSPNLSAMLLNNFIDNVRQKCDFLKAKFGKGGQYFSLGLVVDGITNGYAGCEYSRAPRKLSCENPIKKSVWQISGENANPTANPQVLISLPRSFFRKMKDIEDRPLISMDVGSEKLTLPAPWDWADILVNTWTRLARADQVDAGFLRAEISGGNIFLDGVLVAEMTRKSQPYLALDYIFRGLKNDPSRFFTSREIFDAIDGEEIGAAKEKTEGVAKGNRAGLAPKKSNFTNARLRQREFGNLYKRMPDYIRKIFVRAYAKNPKDGFTLKITDFSKAVHV